MFWRDRKNITFWNDRIYFYNKNDFFWVFKWIFIEFSLYTFYPYHSSQNQSFSQIFTCKIRSVALHKSLFTIQINFIKPKIFYRNFVIFMKENRNALANLHLKATKMEIFAGANF